MTDYERDGCLGLGDEDDADGTVEDGAKDEA
jgi:hypothetical protein